MSSDLLEKIQQLIDSGIGDNGRLEHILSTLQSGKKLYNSDQDYLDRLLDNLEGHTSIKSRVDKSPVKLDENSTPYIRPKQNKPKKSGSLYGIHCPQGNDSVKIHHNSCRHVILASKTENTRWVFVHGYQDAKIQARSIAKSHGTDQDYDARCCLKGVINRATGNALFLTLFPFLGLLGGLIVREYHPKLGKGLMYFGLIYGIVAVVLYAVNRIVL